MPNLDSVPFSRVLILSLIMLGSILAAAASGQSTAEPPYFARRNTLGILTAYSGNSSHILLGAAQNRRILEFGVTYDRRLFLNRYVNWQYSGELLPVALESDPVVEQSTHQTSPTVENYFVTYSQSAACLPASLNYSQTFSSSNGPITYAGTVVQTCGRRWTIGEAMSPAGFQWNFIPRHKVQPFLIGHGGTMYSTHPVPLSDAGSFNFTFDLGAGIEVYRTRNRSIRAEYRYHHISNDGTASQNPGIDNGLFQLTYAFGR